MKLQKGIVVTQMKATKGVVATLLLVGCLGQVSPTAAIGSDGRTMVLRLEGTSVGEIRTLPATGEGGTRQGNCFDVVVWDILQRKAVGSGSHCFTDVKKKAEGMTLTDTIILNLSQGTLVSQDRISIQPALHEPSDVTHIAGAAPSAHSNNIVGKASTKTFSGATGRLRLASGMDMTQFEENNEITFNDLVVVELIDPQDDVRRVQIKLKNLGFYRGNIDGIPGPRTKAALRAYQAKHGLPATGELDEATWKSLATH